MHNVDNILRSSLIVCVLFTKEYCTHAKKVSYVVHVMILRIIRRIVQQCLSIAIFSLGISCLAISIKPILEKRRDYIGKQST
jgi:hypothetical protein